MTRDGWHILREGDSLTMTRALPVRFDVSAETFLPDGNRLCLARQVRQDMWRRLQAMRGFVPIVRVDREADGCRVTAGGRVSGRFPKGHIEAELSEMLGDPALHRRWSAYAARQVVTDA